MPWVLHEACRPLNSTSLDAPLRCRPYFRNKSISSSRMAEERTFSTSSRKKSFAQEHVTSVLRGDEVPVYDREFTADEEVLAALGYKPEFKREFSLWTSFCVSFAVLGLLPSFAATMYYVRTLKERRRRCLTCIRAWGMRVRRAWYGAG